MEFETASNKVYREIREDIIRGKLKPGEKLVRRTLGRLYGVSAIPVMEALYKLEVDGLVESRPMYGTRVRPLTREYFEGEQVMREALECQSARLCALHLDDSGVQELRESAEILDGRMGRTNSDEEMEKHVEFHLSVASVGGADVLVKELEKLFYREFMWATWRSAMEYHTPEGWHNTLVDALCSGNPDEAEAAMREHVQYRSDLLLDLLEQRGL